MKREARILALASLLASGVALAEGPAYRLRGDEGPSHVTGPADARLLVVAGNRLFFVGTDASNGTEVWTSDGSVEGTHLLRDIYPGPDIDNLGGGIPEVDIRRNPTPGPLASLAGILLFAAPDGPSRCVLWRSDGTADGTLPVVNPGREDVPVVPCISLNLGNLPLPMTVSGGHLFFGAYRGNSGPFGLWSTDGTEEGTRYLTPIGPPDEASQLHAADLSGTLAFQGYDPVHGYGLWRSDGTPEGTRFVIALGGPFGTLAPFKSSVVVEVEVPGAPTTPLWLTDLDGGEPVLLLDLTWGLTGIAQIGDRLVFSVFTNLEPDDGLWASDGTPGGTARISTLPGISGVSGLAFAGDVLVGASSAGLFRTDGTAERTFVLTSLTYCSAPTSVGGRAWFNGNASVHDAGVWQTDGTSAGTFLVSSATGGSDFVAIGSRVFFIGADPPYVVWSSDGTPQGTKPIITTTGSFSPPQNTTLLASSGHRAFFASASPMPGGSVDLWFSDGRPAGATRVLSVPAASAFGAAFFHDKVVFLIEGADTELWQSDGTVPGTSQLASRPLISQEASFFFSGLISLGDALVFTQIGAVFDPSAIFRDTRVWRTDGSPEGTTVGQVSLDAISSPLSNSSLVRAGDRLVFPLDGADSGIQLFSTDGTLANTVPFATVGSYSNPVASGSTLFFIGGGLTASTQALGKTDGNRAGTSPLMSAASVDSLVAGPDGLVYFVATVDAGTPRLWRSDGTPAGTVSLVDLPSGAQLYPTSGSVIFFTASDPSTGNELWRTDGTQEGTRLVRDIVPGGTGSNPTSLVSVGRDVVFAASDGESGYELWMSDGTEAGTRLVEDLAPGPGSSSPGQFLVGCGLVFFTADADGIGRDPWAIPLSAIDPAARLTGCGPVVQGPVTVPVRRFGH